MDVDRPSKPARRTALGPYTAVLWWPAMAAALTACAAAPLQPTPALSVPESYRESAHKAVGTITARTETATGQTDPSSLAEAEGGWWRIFGDTQLDVWVTQAREGNPGLALAAARVSRAAATWQLQSAMAQPQVEAHVNASRQIGSLVNAAGSRGNLFNAGLDLRWDADLLQRLSRQQQAALQDLQAQQALQRQARLVLEAEVAQTYLAWRSLVQEQQALAGMLQADRRLVAMAERQARAGLASESVVRKWLAEQRADEADAQVLARRRALLEHALVALGGSNDHPTLTAEPDATASPSATSWPTIPAGLPSRMLQRRADVAAAEANLQAARLRLGLARDAWFPTLALTAQAGMASSELGQWLRAAARNTGLGLLLNLPVFDGGRHEAERATAEAVLAEVTAAHRQQVVQALREVEDQLATLRTSAGETEARAQASALANEDARRARAQWQGGLVGETEAWQTERTALRQRRLWLQALATQGSATVGLVRALGGGWRDDSVASDQRAASQP